ncbi:MAG TPA: phosphodiester glycosidase family protein, partial [Polyangiaceae bacterium]|nr:phosphodiester glycosidase family protein [Polyangiaceae bacterium]
DVSKVRIHAVAGTLEPRSTTFPESLRTGIVPEAQRPSLIAAFNGGFQTIHGGYAMMVDGHRIGEPRADACTVGLYRDGTIRIRSWPDLEAETDRMTAYRQTPRCLVENGQRHPELENRYNTSWGAVVDGGTVIRRSALGVSKDGNVLYFGMGDSLTARSLADGLKAAGAHDVAQLDVNHVFPRFVFFAEGARGLEAVAPLCPGFSFSPGDYVRSPMARYFFYVTSVRP